MDADDISDLGAELDGVEDFDEYTRRAARRVVEAGRLAGCNCNPKILIARPFVDALGVQLEHESTCMGLMRFRGDEGRN